MQPSADITKRMFVQTAVWLAITAALLFVPAGTLDWPEAWLFLAELGILGLASGFVIAQHDPDLVRERMKAPIQREQKSWDKILIAVFFALWLGQYIVIGLDKRFHASELPLWLKIDGALGIAFGLYMFHIVMRANTFAAAVVRIQTEREHRVISTGPYAFVRHPMYGGAIALIFGTPLLLGSWWGVALAVVQIVLLGYRAVLEERTLIAELPGYEDYAARVRWRFVPGVW